MFNLKLSLNTERYENEESLEEFRNSYFETEQLYNWLKKEKGNEKLQETLAQLIDFEIRETIKSFNYREALLQEYKEYDVENKKTSTDNNYDLEELKKKFNLLNDWWGKEGFGYLKELELSRSKYKARMALTFHWIQLFMSELATREKIYDYDMFIEGLENKGFEFYRLQKKWDYPKLKNTEKNKDLIKEVLEKKFPSIIIENWIVETVRKEYREVNYLKFVDVSFSDIKDIKNIKDK